MQPTYRNECCSLRNLATSSSRRALFSSLGKHRRLQRRQAKAASDSTRQAQTSPEAGCCSFWAETSHVPEGRYSPGPSKHEQGAVCQKPYGLVCLSVLPCYIHSCTTLLTCGNYRLYGLPIHFIVGYNELRLDDMCCMQCKHRCRRPSL